MKTKAEKIEEIAIIVNDYGAFTPSEIGEGNPVVNVIGKHSVIVERINANDVDTCEYIDGMEDAIIKQIRINFKAIQNGKLPKDTNIGYSLNKLKQVNEGLYEDYLKEYKNILANMKK